MDWLLSLGLQTVMLFWLGAAAVWLARCLGRPSARVEAALWVLPWLKPGWDLLWMRWGLWARWQGFELADALPNSSTLSINLGLPNLFQIVLNTQGAPGGFHLPSDVVVSWLGPWARGGLCVLAAVLALMGLLAAREQVVRQRLWLRRALEVSAPVQTLTARLGFWRWSVPVHITPGDAAPMVVGLRRPVILMGVGLYRAYSPRQLRAVLGHELAHVERFDAAFRAAALWFGAAMWFVPGVRWALRQWEAAVERACDQAAVRAGADPQALVEALMVTGRRCQHRGPWWVPGLGAGLVERTRSLLEPPTRASRLLRWVAAVLVLILLRFELGVF
mgnify:CR=1 FL=1